MPPAKCDLFSLGHSISYRQIHMPSSFSGWNRRTGTSVSPDEPVTMRRRSATTTATPLGVLLQTMPLISVSCEPCDDRPAARTITGRRRGFSNLAVVFVCHLGNSCSADTPAHSTRANQPFCSGTDLVDAYRRILLDLPSSPLLGLTRPHFRIGRERAAPASPVAKARGGSAASAHP